MHTFPEKAKVWDSIKVHRFSGRKELGFGTQGAQVFIRAGIRTINSILLRPKMARLGPSFGPRKNKIHPKKLSGSPFAFFPRNEAHKFFEGNKLRNFGWGAKIYVEKC